MSARPHHVPDTTPYPWPWCGLAPERVALLVVTTPERPHTTSDRQTVDEVAEAVDAARALGLGVVEVRTRPPPARRSVAAAPLTGTTSPWQINCGVSSSAWDGFFGTPLDSMLRSEGFDQLLLCGWWLETAVHSTMRSANDRGYECLLLSDLAVALDPITARGAVSSVEMSGGIFGAVGTGAAVFQAMQSQPLEEFVS